MPGASPRGTVGAPGVGLRTSILAALLAAVVAALGATVWHQIATEPLIDAAIEIEESAHVGEAEEPVVGRQAQRFGLGVALLLYGVSLALLIGGIFSLVQQWLPGDSPGWRGSLLGLAAGWAFALFPFLKYPANPPGVGDAETLAFRQLLYFGTIALSTVGLVGMLFVGRRIGWLLAVIGYLVLCLGLYVFLPPNPDPITVPLDLLNEFRRRSGLGLVVFWGVFATTFGLLLARTSKSLSAPRA